MDGPRVVIPHRKYDLFRGSLSELGDWGDAGFSDPAFIWPADHAWCLANDVDPHDAGIGASTAAIDDLLRRPALDVVTADPGAEQPRDD